MREKEFNLLYEPWIVILDKNGNQEEVGLVEIFRRAHTIKMLSGELPTQDVAILRLLLALLYAVFLRNDINGTPARIDETENAFDRWSSLWNLGHFPYEVIESYFKKHEERFFLIHTSRPFYQVHIDKGTEYGVSKLIGDMSESGNKVRLFHTRSGIGKERISLAEASRWLIYTNSYDDTSAKPSARGQGMPSVGAGWLGKIGLVYAKGNNLFETLMLNFITWNLQEDCPFPDGKAAWELDVPNSGERTTITIPGEPLSLLTLQSRRLMLLFDEDGVTGYRLLGGDVFPRENAFIEQMTIWRENKSTNGSEFVPKRHDPAKSLWRDFSSLTAQETGARRPGVVKWISALESKGLLPVRKITFQTAGISYGNNDFFVDDVFSDDIAINASLLTGDGLTLWIPRIIKTVGITDECVVRYGRYAAELAKANGNHDENSVKGVSRGAREEAFFKLDIPFRSWLAGIDPETDDLEERIAEWTEIMRNTLLNCAETQMIEAGERALVGKSAKENAFSSFRSFSFAIKKIIGGG